MCHGYVSLTQRALHRLNKEHTSNSRGLSMMIQGTYLNEGVLGSLGNSGSFEGPLYKGAVRFLGPEHGDPNLQNCPSRAFVLRVWV